MRLASVKNLRPLGSLASKGVLLVVFIGLMSSGMDAQTAEGAQQSGADRPHLNHQLQPMTQDGGPDASPDAIAVHDSGSLEMGPSIGDGLRLPMSGHVWAKDVFEGVPQLVQLKYVPTNIDNHSGSNVLKTNMAPFIYKPKSTVEIQGASASIRLHDPKMVIYVRGFETPREDAADSADNTATHTDLVLTKLEPKHDRRVVSTIAFTQVTGKAARSNGVVETSLERVAGTDWLKMTPKEPLADGEYGLMRLPKGQNLFATSVFDFAMDATAPATANAITPQSPPNK